MTNLVAPSNLGARKTIPGDSMKVCGLDVHKKKIVASVVEVNLVRGGGREDIATSVLETSVFDRSLRGLSELADFIRGHGAVKVILESTGPYGISVYYYLCGVGFDVYMVLAKDNRSGGRKKTDSFDAERLARNFISGSVRAYKLPENQKVRQLRYLTRTRKKLVEQRTALKNMILRVFDEALIDINAVFSDIGKGALVFLEGFLDGKNVDDIISEWPRLRKKKKALENLMNKKLDEASILALKSFVSVLKKIDEEVKHLEKHIEAILTDFRDDVRLLLSIPGVGYQSAAIILAEIGNIKRFPSPRKLASYVGVVPNVYQSGGKVVYGKLRSDCNRRLRWIFYEIANHAKRKSPNRSKLS